jgi:hypothetical protein
MKFETYQEMIKEYQCCGCPSGSNPQECQEYKLNTEFNACESHVLGVALGFNNCIALGLPKGFNKPGKDFYGKSFNKMRIRFHLNSENLDVWDHLNIPVWALEHDGILFVRTFLPRMNIGIVDVIQGGTLNLVPNAIDVKKFIEDID